MAKKNYNIIHKRSSINGNLPSPSNLEYGEIAVNYNANNEKLTIKNSNNVIAFFPSMTIIQAAIDEEKTARESGDEVLTSAYTELEIRVRNLESKIQALEG